MNPSAARFGDLRAVARKAAHYAARTFSNLRRRDSRAELQCLALAHLCCTVDDSRSTQEAYAEIARSIDAPVWLAADLITGLAAAASAFSSGAAFRSSAAEYICILTNLGRADGPMANAALIALALDGAPTESTCQRLDREAGKALQSGLRSTALSEALAVIEAKSRYGSIPLESEPPLSTLLEGATLAAFRAYDLPLGMRLLRGRSYVSDSSGLGLSTGAEFIFQSQCRDGGFGDYDTAIAELVAKGDDDASAHIRLPVSFQAIWTLAELEAPGFLREVFGARGMSIFVRDRK